MEEDNNDDVKINSLLNPVSQSNDFSKLEDNILSYWTKIDAFQTSLKQSVGKKIFTFYDGPPFATGLPHYGHILAGTIKDIVTRYWHMKGYYVSRRFGWDCHGLPVEYEIDNALGIKSPADVEKMGIAAYNAECRSIVMRYSRDWESIITRMGRWIDFKNDYKTLDPSFMESVWWVFSELHKKGLVFRGFKVMPFSTGCHTSLSNFEAQQNYKDVKDPAIVISFPLLDEEGTSFLAWTTTPWTLPSNLALCVHPDLEYVKINDKKTGANYWLGESRLVQLYKKKGGDDYTILNKLKGSQLEGMKYVPLFDYFANEREKHNAFRIITDNYVTDSDGTGIVHQAPAFGEDDFRVCEKHGIINRGGVDIPCPVDDSGKFTAEVSDYFGRYVKEADNDIIRAIKAKGRLIQQANLEHSYPHCWRSDTPLLYRTVPSWFVNVPAIKEKLIANNSKTKWVPSFVGEARFHNWLENAREWAISRGRYWGTPLPIWISDDKEEIKVIGSIEELRQLSCNNDITDIHRDKIDHITIPSTTGRGVLRRVPEVFDCWFESGSMPYAQLHYPFENKEVFENGFPADFIAEGLDQTRGWFYTLMVISTALFDKPAFKNLIVNGLVLAEDGKKMSKRLKNYPDPMDVVRSYGADSLRLYLINSPVVRAEPLKFKEVGVREVGRDVFLPWYNSYRFFIVQARRLQFEHNIEFKYDSKAYKSTDNVFDKWIVSSLQTLVAFVHVEMEAYRLYTVIPELVRFIDSLSKWYVRFNKNRLKGDNGVEQCVFALQALFEVLYKLCILMAPFCPFLVESMYQNLRQVLPENERHESVHYCPMLEVNEDARDVVVERRVRNLQEVIELSRTARAAAPFSLRIPAPELIVVLQSAQDLADVQGLSDYIQSDLNVKSLSLSNEMGAFIALSASANRKALGSRLKGQIGVVCDAVSKMTHAQVTEFLQVGFVEFFGHRLEKVDIEILYNFTGDSVKYASSTSSSGNMLAIVDKQLTKECEQEGLAREFMSRVQKLRKSSGISYEDKIVVHYKATGDMPKLGQTLVDFLQFIQTGIRVDVKPHDDGHYSVVATEEIEVFDEKLTIYLVKL